MKKVFASILVITLLSVSPALTLAATPSLTPTQTSKQKTTIPSDSLTQEITNLKDKIASKVAELKLVEKRGIIGVVTDIKVSEIDLTDIQGNTRFIDVDELTKFIGNGGNSFDISDIKKGMRITVLGRYNKESERLLARFVQQVTIPKFATGRIKTIDVTNYGFTITADKTDVPVDVESITKTESFSKSDGIAKYGFSKLRVGDFVIVSGLPDKNNDKMIDATRVLDLLDLQEIQTPTESPTTPSPTSANGK